MRLRTILIGAFVLRLVLALVYPITGDACTHHNTVVMLQQTLGPIDELARGPVWWPYFYHGILALLLYPVAKFSALLALGLDLANVLMGVLGVYMTYLLTQELTKKEDVALLAAGILALFPVHVFYSAVLYTDVPLFAFLLLFIYFCIKERVVLASIFGACAIMSKFNGVIVFPLLGIIFLLKKERWSVHWWKIFFFIGFLTLLLGSGFMIRNTLEYGNPFSFGNGSGALGRDSMLFENINLSVLVQQYFSLFAVPGGNLSVVSSYLPFNAEINFFIVIVWLLGSFFILVPFLFSWNYMKKYPTMAWIVVIVIAFHIYGMMRLGSETGFRYSMIFLFPFGFFSALMLKKWKRKQVAFFFLLGMLSLPLFIQAYLAQENQARSEDLYSYVQFLPQESRIFGFHPCVMANTGHVIEMLPFVAKEEYLGDDKLADYILLNPGYDAVLGKEVIQQIQTEYFPVISSQGMILLKSKT